MLAREQAAFLHEFTRQWDQLKGAVNTSAMPFQLVGFSMSGMADLSLEQGLAMTNLVDAMRAMGEKIETAEKQLELLEGAYNLAQALKSAWSAIHSGIEGLASASDSYANVFSNISSTLSAQLPLVLPAGSDPLPFQVALLTLPDTVSTTMNGIKKLPADLLDSHGALMEDAGISLPDNVHEIHQNVSDATSKAWGFVTGQKYVANSLVTAMAATLAALSSSM